jgi:hypothetical protein
MPIIPLDILNLDTISSKVTYRLINVEINKERLKTMPHNIICDLAKVYNIIVKSDENGLASIAVTNDLLEYWNYTVEEIDKLAEQNTPILFPPTIRTMKEVFYEMFQSQAINNGKYASEEEKELLEQLYPKDRNQSTEPDEIEMYILSNTTNLNGASALFYPNVLQDFAVSHQSNLYILPSSIHEVILIPENRELSKEYLCQMVIDVNQTQVPIEEVLSNEVYYYNYQTKELSIAKE